MPAVTKKSITRSLSKKWNLVRGNKKKNNIPAEEEAAIVSDTSSEDSDSSGGDEDIAEQYGYGGATRDTGTKSFPKRLFTRNSIRRRNSICRQTPLSLNGNEHEYDDETLPFDPHRAPQRSSIKGTCPQRAHARARRRASIVTCTFVSSIEEELASGTLQPSQVVEIWVPGRREESTITRRTAITFNEDINVRKIQAILNVKGAVKQELWYQAVEYLQIKQKTRALIDKVDALGHCDGKKYCTRGLEKYMACPQQRASKKCQGWEAVFREQKRQRQLQTYDAEAIGQCYQQTAAINVMEATHRGQVNAAEVASFYTTSTATTTTTTTAPGGDDRWV